MTTVAPVSVVLAIADRPRAETPCTDDPELFFPVGTSGPALLQIAEAKAHCQRCPALDRCLALALETGQDHGIWGATTEQERRALRRRGASHGRRRGSRR
ncbi:WhiB family transcriptional regulator [Pseudonocardia sp. WMMC193]|uniref:WhiB family transcriptional regulator n=1 Tax=Pseudonocardia sp. WMMC193 TaxID=2911965 RepID=UPI0035AB780D